MQTFAQTTILKAITNKYLVSDENSDDGIAVKFYGEHVGRFLLVQNSTNLNELLNK